MPLYRSEGSPDPVHAAPDLAIRQELAGAGGVASVYQHAWLPLLPTMAVYAGLALATLGEWARRSHARWPALLAAAAIAAAVVVPAGASVVFASRNQNAEDLALMREQLGLPASGAPVGAN